MADITIKIRPNGPYLVPAAGVTLVDGDGKAFDISGKENVALCRCGGSVNKPFCDGTHSKMGFEAATKAVAESG